LRDADITLAQPESAVNAVPRPGRGANKLHKIIKQPQKLSPQQEQKRRKESGGEKHTPKMKASLQKGTVKMHKKRNLCIANQPKCNKKMICKTPRSCYNTTNIFLWRTVVHL
jgi:hypothetical protein